jgi:hypothetical protein
LDLCGDLVLGDELIGPATRLEQGCQHVDGGGIFLPFALSWVGSHA